MRRRFMQVPAHRRLAFVVPLVAVACSQNAPNESVPPASVPPVQMEFALDPPRVEEQTVQLLDAPTPRGENAVMTVRFAPDRRLGPALTIRPDSVPVVLRDDGRAPDVTARDRVFAAFVRFPVEEARARRRPLERLDLRQESIPVFENRRLVDRIRPEVMELLPRRPFTLHPFGPLTVVDPARSLMVTDPGVIKDPARTFDPCTSTGTPMGKWTFGYLMQEMANQSATGLSPSAFVRQWLAQWEANQTVNTFTVGARPSILGQVIQPWENASGGPTLDLAKAPFRLVAIVNRLDLRENTVYGGGVGEGRFVFELVDPSNGCAPLLDTVILEYGLPGRGCPAAQQWAQKWVDLTSFTPGTAAYNNRLEQITEGFAKAGAAPSKPNGSALNQVRTNEIVFGSPWELREFRIDGASHHLASAPVTRNPSDAINQTAVLANYVNANAAKILAGTHAVPNDFPGAGNPFLGGAASTPSPAFFWDGPGASPSTAITTAETRHLFSLNTCNGCHGGETSTFFQHVSGSGQSGFLTGITVTDPAGETAGSGPKTRTFNDLDRRRTDLSGLVTKVCFAQLPFKPLHFVH